MNYLSSSRSYRPAAIIVMTALVCSNAIMAHADTRQDALLAVSGLKQSAAAQRFPDDISSLNQALLRAEQYQQAQDNENADKYYLLTVQKARIIEALLHNTDSTPLNPPPSPSAPLVQQQPTQQEPPPKQPVEPAPAEPATTESGEHEQTENAITSSLLVGKISAYTVKKGDTLRLVAAKLGVSRQQLQTLNHLDSKASLKIGQELKYNNRRIIPQRMRDGIVVNIPDRMLYYFQQGKLVKSLPVALGTATKNEKYVWQTPTGKFKITAKQKDPTWYVPSSIQTEMEEQGKDVIISIPPGPENPLGKYAIKTSIPGILIHSTTKPWSIYSFASHGCIRVFPDHMEELFKEIKVNTPGEIIYRPVKLVVTETGKVLMEVHNDIYNKSGGLTVEAKKLVEKHKLKDQIDWTKFESVLRKKSGVAEDISL